MLNKLRQKHASGLYSLTLCCDELPVQLSYKVVTRPTIYCLICDNVVPGDGANYGVDINTGGIADSFANFVWEPAVVKVIVLSF